MRMMIRILPSYLLLEILDAYDKYDDLDRVLNSSLVIPCDTSFKNDGP